MKRTICMFLAITMVLLGLTGCNKMPTVDESVQPAQIFSYYKTLTDQYGLSMSETLKNLKIDPQEVFNNNSSIFGIPWKEAYGGITFDVGLDFGTGEQFTGVRYQTTYQYPDNELQLLQDIVTISKQMISDFGDELDATYAFNWVEVYLDEEWDRDIRYWEDISVLKRLLDEGYAGPLLKWDITAVAGERVQTFLKARYGDEGRRCLDLSVYTDQDQGLAFLHITY